MYFYLNYLAWKSKFFVPYYVHLRPVWLCRIFRYHRVNGTTFGEMCVLISTSICNLSPSRKNFDTYYHIRTQVFVKSARYFHPIVTKLDISPQVLIEPPISNCTNIRPFGLELLHANKRPDMTTVTVAFWNCTNAANKTAGMAHGKSLPSD